MLAVERRKTTLNIVAESTDIVELNDLAMMVAERETDEVDPERIAVTLHHIHLPKMADAGVINYDPDTTRVEPRP